MQISREPASGKKRQQAQLRRRGERGQEEARIGGPAAGATRRGDTQKGPPMKEKTGNLHVNHSSSALRLRCTTGRC